MREIDTSVFTELAPVFAELDREAAIVAGQNDAFNNPPKCGVEASAVNCQNRIYRQQAEHIGYVGSMSSELPYEALGRTIDDAQSELEDLQARLGNLDAERCPRILAVEALSARIAECYPVCEDRVPDIVSTRQTDVKAAKLEEMTQRIGYLTGVLEQLDGIIPSGTAWPIPLARELEVPAEPKPSDPAARRGSNGEIIGETELKVIEGGGEGGDTTPEERLRDFRERHIDQPELSQFIVYYMIEKSGQVVEVDELYDYAYSNVTDHAAYSTHSKRSKITSACGPKVKGARIRRMLAEEEHVLQYGTKTIYEPIEGSEETRQVAEQRVYRAVPLKDARGRMDADGRLPEFNIPVIRRKDTSEHIAEAA